MKNEVVQHITVEESTSIQCVNCLIKEHPFMFCPPPPKKILKIHSIAFFSDDCLYTSAAEVRFRRDASDVNMVGCYLKRYSRLSISRALNSCELICIHCMNILNDQN